MFASILSHLAFILLAGSLAPFSCRPDRLDVDCCYYGRGTCTRPSLYRRVHFFSILCVCVSVCEPRGHCKMLFRYSAGVHVIASASERTNERRDGEEKTNLYGNERESIGARSDQLLMLLHEHRRRHRRHRRPEFRTKHVTRI